MDTTKQLKSAHDSMREMVEEENNKNDVKVSIIAKMMEEKHTYTYKKLVVPISMRSIYWKFFGFPATEEGDILTKVKIVCILCKTQIAYNRNTSNLRMHLQNKHAQELSDLEAGTPPKKIILTQEARDKRAQKRMIKAGLNATQHIYTTSADGTVQIDGDLQFVTDPNISLSSMEDDIDNPLDISNMDGKAVSDAITEFIVMDLQLPEVVEGRGFQRLVATLRSPCEIPSKNKLEDELIPKVYETFRESVAANLACVNGEFGLAVEEWRSNSGEYFVTLSLYYQNVDEAILECKVLTTLHAPLDWGETQWSSVIDSTLLDWDLRIERITAAVVATSRPELLASLSNRGLALVPCLLHTLQVCAQACFENADVAITLSKCRTTIGVIASHGSASTDLNVQEQLLELEENAMLMDYPAVWTSTYNMLEQLILRRNIITSILESMEGIDREAIELTEDQWKIIEDLVNVLEPFKVTIMTLSEEKMPLISLLKPLLWQLVSSHLKVKDDDSEIAKSFKESLSDMLCERYADSNVTLLLQIATTLDPRFKQLPYAPDEDKNMVNGPIKEMLTKLVLEETGGLCAVKSGMPAEEKANLELVQYQSEATAPLDCCPLQWWAKTSVKCPNLGKLARRYNCVPACCAPPSRIPAETQVLYDTRRAALPSHLVNKLLFLHGNHAV
ncbi:E3 SUMO-protein ligase ZBED1-like isoform X2 [Venturia canescens]|uniref:E3 SUMO-protein ligase ZBED1-like isoform X2 n=1 Tax=Venturia canescens TaxID=32260 RepID=UPI001C9CEB99|nr:E3 SUMO-protein ligase ZBED1-like isoform X2 [Venturia canescens]